MPDKGRIAQILEEINYSPQHVAWGPHRDEAFALATAIDGYRVKGAGCLACHLKVVNILRHAIDMPPVGGEASESLRSRRLKVCRGTDGEGRCEHLAWPGTNCSVCGCFVDIKASFRKFRCPLGKWPMA